MNRPLEVDLFVGQRSSIAFEPGAGNVQRLTLPGPPATLHHHDQERLRVGCGWFLASKAQRVGQAGTAVHLLGPGQGLFVLGQLDHATAVVGHQLVGAVHRGSIGGGGHARPHPGNVDRGAFGYQRLEREFVQTAGHDDAHLR